MLKILQGRFQQNMNQEFPDVQAGFRKGRGTRDQIAKICWIVEKARDFQKTIYFCFIDLVKPLTVWIKQTGKFFKKWECQTTWPVSWKTFYADQEATVKTGHGTTDWFKMGKWVRQGYILSPCLFNLDAEYIMRNVGLDEAQAGIKIARRNINNLRYTDDTALKAENKEEF